jgi:hypothetical protein
MITYEELQAMSKEICDIDKQLWNAALLKDSESYEKLQTLMAGKIKVYELAYNTFYVSYQSQPKSSNTNI